MQDADTQHDQSAAEMLKASTAVKNPCRTKGGMRQAPAAAPASSSRPSKAPLAVAATAKEQAVVKVSQDAAEAPEDDCMQSDEAPTAAAAATGQPARASAAAPASKRQKTSGKKAPARKAKQAPAEAEPDSDEADDADKSDTAAAAAAADAARFTADEVTEINTSLIKWYDHVMRILPWRRNPHHKPDQQQQGATATSALTDATAAAAGSSGSSKGGKQKKPSKAELAAAEAKAVVAAAKPAPADLSPQQFAYCVWVSEIMLQQTQVARVITYFNNWIAAWPTVQDLAQATQEQVNEVWAGLGYYRRARYLLEGAQFIMDKLDGVFPETAAGMRQIPGVGPYTAAAVASIAFNDPAAAVDGNVIRVISRLRALKGNPTKMAKTWDRLAAELLHSVRPGCHNQAMMELGATVCKPVNPLCEACPVSSCCTAYKQVSDYAASGGAPDVEDAPRVTDYPEKVAKAAKHEQHVAVCVLKVLLLPGVNTPAELEAAAATAGAAAGSSSGAATAAKKQKGSTGPAAAAGAGGKQGKINAFFRPAAKPSAAAAAADDATDQQQQLCEQDVLAAGGTAHYLLVQRPATGLLAGLWEFPGVITDGELNNKSRRAAAYSYLSSTLGIQGLQPAATADTAKKTPSAAAAGGGGSGVRIVHQRQLGSAVHIFSHIRQTMHAEELVLLAPSLDAVCPTAAAAAEVPVGSSKKRKGGGGEADGGEGEGGSGSSRPSMRWVSADEIGQQGLTSGVRKVLQLSLK